MTIDQALTRELGEEPGNKTFFELYQPEIQELFDVLGMERTAVANLPQAVEATQPWVEGDHFTPKYKTVLEGDQAARALEVYERMGLVDEQLLPHGEYDQLIVLGGTQRANNERINFLKQQLADGAKVNGPIILWGGERSRDVEREAAELGKNIANLSDSNHSATQNPWLEVQRSNKALPENETELLRIAALQLLGNLPLKKMYIRLDTEVSGQPLISRYEFDYNGQRLILMHTAAVARPQGEPRHTTEACAREWLEALPPKTNARVAFVTGNPYIRRTAQVVQKVLAEQGRMDIELIACGPAAYDNARDYLFLGEIGRNLYEDLRSTS